MALSLKHGRQRSPTTGKKTLEQLMSAYKSLLAVEVDRDKETLFLQTLQNQNELVQMLHIEKQKLSTETEEIKRKYEELLKENSLFRDKVASHRQQLNYSPKSFPDSEYTSQTLKELSRVASASSHPTHLRPLTPRQPTATLEATAAEEELKVVKEENKNLQDKVQKLTTENKQLLDNVRESENSRAQLNKQLDDSEKNMEEFCHNNDVAYKQIETLTKENERLKEEMKTLRKDNSQLHEGIKRLRSGYAPSPGYFSGFGGFRQPSPKAVSIQLVSRHVTSHGDVLRDLAAQVTASLLQQNIQAVFAHSETASDARPLVVACLRALRLGTDVNEALSGINRDASVGLVVLHHQGPHVRQCDVTEKQLSSEISELGLVVDVVFWKDRRLYESDINSAALTRLCSYLSQFAK